MNPVKTPPSDHVYQLILEQFWGDGVSKREIRCVYTSAEDANWACRDYLLRTWPKDHFTMYDEVTGPQGDPSLIKIAAEIQGGDRFNCWVEKQPFKGQLDFSSKAIAKRAGKGPNAYILQRTIKDAQGGKRRSTTRGIFATRLLAKEALAADQPPAEWSSNQGYVLEPGGEYASAMSPSGKTAWLFIEVRPLYMSYTRLDQELQISQQQTLQKPSTPTGTTEGSATNPISLDGADGTDDAASSTLTAVNATATDVPVASVALAGGPVGVAIPSDPFSPLIANPDEAGAYVYLVLQLKTIPFTPPILTVEAVTYELEVANQFGLGILDLFCEPLQHLNVTYDPAWRDDGCLQVTIERPDIEDGLTVWVEKRAVVLGDNLVAAVAAPDAAAAGTSTITDTSLDPSPATDLTSLAGYTAAGYMLGGGGPGMDYQLLSEHASIQYDAHASDRKKEPLPVIATETTTATTTWKKREGSAEEPHGGHDGDRPAKAAKLSTGSTVGVVNTTRRFHVVRQLADKEKVVLGSFDELKKAKTFARVKCYATLHTATSSSGDGATDDNDTMDEVVAADVQEEEHDNIVQTRGDDGNDGAGVLICFRIRAVSKEGYIYDDLYVHDTQPDLAKTESIKNTAAATVGGAKEKIGHATHSEQLAASGAEQRAQAHASQQAHDTQRHTEGLGNKAKGQAQKAAGSLTNDPSMEARGHANAAQGDVQRNI
ncbi:hypothetical protein BGW42_005669 [Actinomortierella wolfii]|nr:hypothetical protein BGW42_005669 [Actinomortierella wolfii]